MIQAKFKCDDVSLTKDTEIEGNPVIREEVSMSPVISGSEENKSFAEATPSGSIKLTITNPNAFGFFGQGLEYLIDFQKAN